MESSNHTWVSTFSLLGLSDNPELQTTLFGLFLFIYLVTLFGNLLIILAIGTDSRLHTPMYFFLSNLSFVDIGFISTTVPKMLMNIQAQNTDISYMACLIQVFSSNTFLGMDSFLLTIMAYDRFVAICHPLNYTVIMNSQLCGLLILVSWIIMLWISLIHILLLERVNFSIGTEIPNFFCELALLLKATSSDTLVNNIFIYLMTALLAVFPFTGILFSYLQIASTLMRMSSTISKYKAFSTCGSHLCVVSLFYGSGLGVYISSSVNPSSQGSTIASVMYMVVTPMLNPFIYSLRNKDVKGALERLFNTVATAASHLHG